ncbi:hypothetical protein FRB93_000490 [Tulasnella sp. JGI-2019a]|nr:hypothetical protein FRB93_000490 [Tulasnella sp. JGI-2019a]
MVTTYVKSCAPDGRKNATYISEPAEWRTREDMNIFGTECLKMIGRTILATRPTIFIGVHSDCSPLSFERVFSRAARTTSDSRTRGWTSGATVSAITSKSI